MEGGGVHVSGIYRQRNIITHYILIKRFSPIGAEKYSEKKLQKTHPYNYPNL